MAVTCSRISHFLFYSTLVLPGAIGIFYPGLSHFDEILGIPPLPFQTAAFLLGSFIVSFGVYFSVASNRSLATFGEGAAAFRLTQKLVDRNIYKRVRNPMSLGYYLLCLGVSLMAGSTYLTIGTVLAQVPVHIFNLKYFEERELEVRHGQAYLQYKQGVPFLIPNLREK